MTDKPGIGRNIYRQEIARGRQSVEAIRRSLLRLNEDPAPGPREAAQLITRAALALNEIQSVFSSLDAIGQHARNTQELSSLMDE